MNVFQKILLSGTFILVLNQIALSCVCAGPDSPKEALKYWSDTVFSGEITAVEILKVDKSKVAVLTFKVENAWKGVNTKEIVVRDYAFGSDCAPADFKVGERYIIFANSKNSRDEPFKDDQNNPFISIDPCSWTANLANPAAKKKILNKIGKGKPIK
jgi:hypothetical protein